MTEDEMTDWEADFVEFQSRFSHLFQRSEPRKQTGKYLRGLMDKVERKNGWQLAEAVGDRTPDATERLLYKAEWEADAAQDVLQGYVMEVFGSEEGIGVVDETGFLKKGEHSVGVKRQYSGTAGKVENCQVGVFLSYVGKGGHVFLDRKLYLPQEWCSDLERRQKAKVPETITFQTKPELATAMLEHAWEQGVQMRWVTGDEVYGNSKHLRDTVHESGRQYVLAVACDTTVWVREQVQEGTSQREAVVLVTVADIVAKLSAAQWRRLTVAEGTKGPRTYDWASVRVYEHRPGKPGQTGKPGREAWLLVRRSLSESQELAYYLSNAGADLPLLMLAQVAATRYTVEQCLEEAKGETGLDEYEVRSWPSWHRHITLSLMAHTWLAATRSRVEKKDGSDTGTRPTDSSRSPSFARRGSSSTSSFAAVASRLVNLAPSQALARTA
jgi:SRSO17 transposase